MVLFIKLVFFRKMYSLTVTLNTDNAFLMNVSRIILKYLIFRYAVKHSNMYSVILF